RLLELVTPGHRRHDLSYRRYVSGLPRPGLRERPEDMPHLARPYLDVIGEQSAEPARKLDPEAMSALQGHRLSGNVRELVNILQRAVTLCESDIIGIKDLGIESSPLNESEIEISPPEDQNLDDYMSDIEKGILEKALQAANHNKTEAARPLGISFRSLRYKLKNYGIDGWPRQHRTGQRPSRTGRNLRPLARSSWRPISSRCAPLRKRWHRVCPPKTRTCSRPRSPARPSGTAHTPPGFLKPLCSSPTARRG